MEPAREVVRESEKGVCVSDVDEDVRESEAKAEVGSSSSVPSRGEARD